MSTQGGESLQKSQENRNFSNRMVVSSDSSNSESSTILEKNNFHAIGLEKKENQNIRYDKPAQISNETIKDFNTNSMIYESENNIYSTINRLPDPEEETENEIDEIIMCVLWRNAKFAAACYNLNTSEISILYEMSDSKSDFKFLISLYRQFQPSTIITDSRSAAFVDTIKSLISENISESSENNTEKVSKISTQLQFLSIKEYNFESCRRRVYSLKLPNMPMIISENNYELFLQSIIDFKYLLTVHALGALLKYLDKNWSNLRSIANDEPLYLAVNIISLDKNVYIDNESYKALQIFNKLSHPSNFKKGTIQSAKEGLSIYNIFNRCCSKIGSQHLKLTLQTPTNDMEILKRRLDTIEFCIKPGKEEIVKNICSSLKHIRNVNGIMTRIRTLRVAPYEWKLLFNTLYNAILICEICENHKGNSALVDDLGSRNNNSLFQVAHHMNRVINFDLTNTQGRFTVNLGIDLELDKKKQKMMRLHDLMSSTAKFELQKLPDFIEECTMVYLPNLGYLLGVKAWKENFNENEKFLPDLKFMNHDYIYYKSKGCDELDILIGDTYPEILAHEMRIMMRLTQYILQNLESLSTVIKLCAELDCFISIARVCKDNDYKRPILTSNKIVDIKNGRHPLQELCVNHFVPNDTYSSKEKNLMTLLIGPNSCGKSVYLKQVAIIVYMAHIGCFVPAESAIIGLIDHIFTRIQTTEDISTRMSAFLIDLRQMSNAIRNCTPNSLIIIDEFGKGTSELDGLGLLAACLNNFLFCDDKCPHVFVSTHFHNLIQILKPSPYMKTMSLEYMIHDNKIIFLYKLTEGLTEKSFAHEVAQNAGIDRCIRERAKEILQSIANDPEPVTSLKRHKINKKYVNVGKEILINKLEISKAEFSKIKFDKYDE